MKNDPLPLIVAALFALALIGVVVYPHLDLIVSGWFYQPGEGFFMAENPVFNFLHRFAIRGAWYLGFFLTAMLPVAFLRRGGFLGLQAKEWFFLLLALLVGPVLIANETLKDHWGRARPREVAEFGDPTGHFSPALLPQSETGKNGSFVSGDGAFGFYLPCFAYLVAPTRPRRSRRVFWGCMAVGCCFALARIAMGAHFLSDNLFAALFMLASAAGLHAVMYGRANTRAYWRAWLSIDS